MARFVSPHDRLLIEELSQDSFKILAPLWFESDLLGGRVIKVPEGFISDRESIPRWLPIFYALLAGTASRAGVVHDRLYQLHKVVDLDVSRKLADAVYYEANALDQNPGWKRWLKWLGLRIGGALAYKSGPSRFQTDNDRRRKPRTPLSPEDRRRLEALARQSAAERGKPTPPPPAVT